MDEEKEIWKIYKKNRQCVWEVSNFGRVKKNGEIYECKKTSSGYLVFCSGIYLHKAIAEMFIPNPDNKPHVDHIDTNKLNNHVDNLRWCTQKENCNNPLSIQHYSETMKGNKNRSGKKSSIETKKKLSEATKGHIVSIETRKKISESNKGKFRSELSKKKISESHKGIFKGRSWFLGSDGKRHWV